MHVMTSCDSKQGTMAIFAMFHQAKPKIYKRDPHVNIVGSKGLKTVTTVMLSCRVEHPRRKRRLRLRT